MSTTTTTQPAHDPSSPQGPMLHALAKNWWLLLLRGIAAIIFGILAILFPDVTFVTLVLFYGAFALVDGVLAIAAAITGGASPVPRWWLAVVGIAGIAAGILTFMWPGGAALVILIFIAVWAIVLGVMEIYGAIKLRKEIDNEWLLILGGLLSVVFGFVLLYRPAIGVTALIYVVGAYAIAFGVIYIGFAFKLKKHLGAHADAPAKAA